MLQIVLAVLFARAAQADCVSRIEVRTVRGDSLGSVAPQGTRLKLVFDYYGCHEVERGDVVAFRYAGNPWAPVVKVARGLPGDSFAVVPHDTWHELLIEGKAARTHDGRPYRLDDGAERVLSRLARTLGGVIPPDAYLLLGERPDGSIDATRVGLVAKNQLLAKAVVEPMS